MNQIKHKCATCGKLEEKSKLCVVDNIYYCVGCMYGGVKPFEIYPIGVVKNNLQRSSKDFGVIGKGKVSKIEIIPTQKTFMYKLDEEEYLTIVYYLHKTESVKSVFNRGFDGKKVGVFASRTPKRLSKIAIQDVKLIKIENTTLFVKDLDAVNGSLVLDIKMKWSTRVR